MTDYNDYLKYLKHIDDTTKQDVEAEIDKKNIEIIKLKKDFDAEKLELENSLNIEIDRLNNTKKQLETDIANLKNEIRQKEIEVKNATENSSVLRTQKKLNVFLRIFVFVLMATTLFFAITAHRKTVFIDRQNYIINELTESNAIQ